MKLLLATIAAIGLATLNAMSDTTRIYVGHNATGSAAYAISGDLPDAIIAFLAEKLLD